MKFDSIMVAAEANEMILPEGWGQGRATFGGLVGAILIRHMQAYLARELPEPPPLRSFALTFVGPAVPGPLALSAEILRSGKSVTQMQVTARQEGQVVSTMLASLGHARESSIRVPGPAAPDWKPAEEYHAIPFMEGVSPDFLREFEMRPVAGQFPYSGSDKPDFEGYMSFRERPERQDAASLACLVDVWPPSVIPMLTKRVPSSSMTWIMEFLEDPAELPWTDHWLYTVHTDSFADGYGQNRSVIWDGEGRPVAFSRQTIVVFG